MAASLANLTPGGRVVVVAIHERPMDLLPTQLVMGETAIVGTLAYLQSDFDAVIAAMAAGGYTADGWVDDVAVDDVVGAIESLRAGRGMKVLLRA